MSVAGACDERFARVREIFEQSFEEGEVGAGAKPYQATSLAHRRAVRHLRLARLLAVRGDGMAAKRLG